VSVELLHQVGLQDGPLPAGLDAYAHPPITDPRGAQVGEVRPAFRLARSA